ncbi:MAG TPA: prepilin-type N-terminal cleavage/methylation domain-containing protein [Vicinamibacteria bacterium]|nr:prepilin-type N-terminal cleavage/methylation domain-containing protein [Vicinamibacteria bacterium]
MRRNAQAGFSLIELMVAMVVTLFVVGAMFGLLTGGQTAFKTQPERTDRQQNIRAAMDIMMRDVGAAGIGMPTFMQVFSTNMNNVGPATAATVSGELTDQLMTIANTEGFENEEACNYPGGHASHVFMKASNSRVTSGQPVIVILANGKWALRAATGVDPDASNTHSGECEPPAIDKHADVDFSPGAADTANLNAPGGVCANPGIGTAIGDPDCQVQYISTGDICWYRVNNGPDGVPNLERNLNNQGWQVIARGIEDLQIQYVAGNLAATPVDNAPVITPNDYSTLTVQVRVTMSARGSAGRFQGATQAAQGPMAIRASLNSQASPRMALWSLTQQPSPQPSALPWN